MAKEYGLDTTKLERMVKIEVWLDQKHDKWFIGSIPSESKRKIESYFDEVTKSSIDKYIMKIRDKKRRSKIKERLDNKHSEWPEEDLSSEAKDCLTDLLHISDNQLKEYLQDLRRERKNR